MKKPFGPPMTIRQASITAAAAALKRSGIIPATAQLCGFDMVGDDVLVPVD